VSHTQSTSGAIVTTSSGRVRGAVKEYVGQNQEVAGEYYSFRGIPYAEPPVGDLIWRDPVPVSAWGGEIDGTKDDVPVCIQPGFFFGKLNETVGELDCLFLSIYTTDLPSVNPSMDLKPVFFWIHGGGFVLGSGDLGVGADYLLESGLVVVTINYRLGPMGFMALEGSSIAGNQGLKDQLVALRWVKENIANFGGDPNRITIAGESAGGVSVHAHVLSPLGKDENLFHSAIAFSGTMLMGHDFVSTVADSNMQFMEDYCAKNGGIHFDVNNPTACATDYNDLVWDAVSGSMAGEALPPDELVNQSGRTTYYFWANVDYWAETPFIPSHPITILHNKQQKMVPFMTGVNADEGAMITANRWKWMSPEDNQLQRNWDILAGVRLFFRGYQQTFDERLESRVVTKFYLGGQDGVTRENKQAINDMFTDVYFAYPNTEAVKLHAQATAPIYNYLLSYRGSTSYSVFFSMGDPETAKENFGVVHADDLIYTFRGDKFLNSTLINTDEDRQFLRTWQKVISNFVKYADPTPMATNDIPKWKMAQDSRAACVYMDLNLEPAEKHRIFAERMEFWNRMIFQDLLEKYAVSYEEDELLIEIDSAIATVEEENEDEDEENEDGINVVGKRHGGKKGKGRRGRGAMKNMKKKMLRKRKRLARKLKTIKCQ